MVLKNVSMPFRSSDKGPAQERINFIPLVVHTRIPPFGTLAALGRNPYVPQQVAGIRTEPWDWVSFRSIRFDLDPTYRQCQCRLPMVSLEGQSGHPRLHWSRQVLAWYSRGSEYVQRHCYRPRQSSGKVSLVDEIKHRILAPSLFVGHLSSRK